MLLFPLTVAWRDDGFCNCCNVELPAGSTASSCSSRDHECDERIPTSGDTDAPNPIPTGELSKHAIQDGAQAVKRYKVSDDNEDNIMEVHC